MPLQVSQTGSHALMWTGSSYAIEDTSTGREVGRVERPGVMIDVSWPYVICASKNQMWVMSGHRRNGLYLAEVLRLPMRVTGFVVTGYHRVVVVWVARGTQYWGVWRLSDNPRLVRSGTCSGFPIAASNLWLKVNANYLWIGPPGRRPLGLSGPSAIGLLSMATMHTPHSGLRFGTWDGRRQVVPGGTNVIVYDNYDHGCRVEARDGRTLLRVDGFVGTTRDAQTILVRKRNKHGPPTYVRHRVPQKRLGHTKTFKELRHRIDTHLTYGVCYKLLMNKLGLAQEMAELVLMWGI